MFFSSRMSRQKSGTPEQSSNNASLSRDSPVIVESPVGTSPVDQSEQPSSSSPHHISDGSEGYPSWLPKRPPPPAPGSTLQSSVGMPGPSEHGGRKPTPRSVRIVSLQDTDRREPTDQTRVSNAGHTRVWSRATAPTVFSSQLDSRIPQPKFRSTGLHLELLRSPSWKTRLYFYLYPLLVFAHIPLQTFFDFNAVFILIQVAKFPNPEAPGVPGSGRNWALGAAAYIACWVVWIVVVFVVYELVYSFVRRWRIKRPLMLQLYLSSPAFNFVAMSSYTNFSFMQYIRYNAFFGESGSIRDGLAETFFFYSQNLPTVALLLPRAGLCLALLLTFSSPQPGVVALADAGINHRDGTFFRRDDGTLTDYARGVLIANAAWTAWRTLVLWCSWIGLWIISGQGCAGLCGPRYRWEEGDAEKAGSVYNDAGSAVDALPWGWRECTRARVQEAYDFCTTTRPSSRWGGPGKKEVSASELLGAGPAFEGVEQVLAAVGLPTVPAPARRGVLSEELFAGPAGERMVARAGTPPELAVVPKAARGKEREGPLRALPYPFAARSAHASSEDQTERVPFPPSPAPSGEEHFTEAGIVDEHDDEDEEEEEEEEEDEEEEEEGIEGEEPSSGRASGSMSSLGQPVTSRYPFQFRRPVRGNSLSSGAASHMTPQSRTTPSSNSRSANSRVSRSTQSTGNRESTEGSHSPRSGYVPSDAPSPLSERSSMMPPPPRHPQGRRARAGTVPSALPSSPSPVVFPRGGRPRARTRTESGATQTFSGATFESDVEEEGLSDEDVGDDSHDVDDGHDDHDATIELHDREEEDVVGLLSDAPLSLGPSPKSSFTALRQRASSSFGGRHPRLSGSRSGSSANSRATSRTNSQSGSSLGSRPGSGTLALPAAMRSRAQSLIQSVGAASQSSLELVQSALSRSRANSSMARLEEDVPYYSSHSRSASGSGGATSGEENYTFGQPIGGLRAALATRAASPPARATSPVPEAREASASPVPPPQPERPPQGQPQPQPQPQESNSNLSVYFTQSERTVSPLHSPASGSDHGAAEPAGVPIPGVVRRGPESPVSSRPDISTAAQSFVTAPATIEGTTDSSGRTISSWGGPSHMVQWSDPTRRPM